MSNYNEVKKLIINTLTNRPSGTEIQPEDHQWFALQLLDYARQIELAASSGFMGYADANKVPIQPDDSNVSYISSVPSGETITFLNFFDKSGNAISVTAPDGETDVIILIWNTKYWDKHVIPFKTGISLVQEEGSNRNVAMSQQAVTKFVSDTKQEIVYSKGKPNGIATLDVNSKLDPKQIPSSLYNVLEFDNKESLPVHGEVKKLYVTIDTDLLYRWNGTQYIEVSKSLGLGETESTAYAGSKGKKNREDLIAEIERATERENNIENALDAEKQRAITAENSKQATLVSGQNIKSVDGESLLGSGNVSTYPQGGYIREEAGSAGAKWHPESVAQDGTHGAYWLNGLKDITIAQMAEIIFRGRLRNDAAQQYTLTHIRTNIGDNISIGGGGTPSVFERLFFKCSNLEVVSLFQAYVKNLREAFSYCPVLRKIQGFIYLYKDTVLTRAFVGCVKLEDVKIQNLASNLSFADCPNLSVGETDASSVGYILYNAIGGSADKHISLTFHHDVYVKTMAIPTLVAKAQELYIDLIDANPA